MASDYPWFPLYVKDWMAGTYDLTTEQRGAYVQLLCAAWERGGLPTDPESCRKLAACTAAEWRRVWPALAPKWTERDGRLVNERQEIVRLEQVAKRTARVAAGSKGLAKRWQSHSNAIGLPLAKRSQTDSSTESDPDKKIKTSCAETSPARSTPQQPPLIPATVLLTFPTDGRTPTWALTDADVARWSPLFPHLDVMQQCREALAWVQANPQKRKTASGMPSFLSGWLTRSNNRPRSAAPSAVPVYAPPAGPTPTPGWSPHPKPWAQVQAEQKARDERNARLRAEESRS